MAKKKEEKNEEPIAVEIELVVHQNTRKEFLLGLYKTLQDEGIRSISDLENLIARA